MLDQRLQKQTEGHIKVSLQGEGFNKTDSYKLQSRVHTDTDGGPRCILSLLNDESRWLRKLRSLARDEALGKDGIPNEVLMTSPDGYMPLTISLFSATSCAAHLRIARKIRPCFYTRRMILANPRTVDHLPRRTRSPTSTLAC